ncbi:amidase [Arthrobacter sp. AB6]|uniref:amidase n=1 Tax=Arthrobacter sp. AB6 TaxID=2962570 RepID=UPI0028828C91|nr:amidase [Arthrobacter sp. AB6]MDT0196681.1 amidase [Arthrobacter sp. AB6]
MNNITEDLDQLSALKISALVKSKEISPRESVEAAIKKIQDRNPLINAVVFQGFQDARDRAQLLEKRIMAGEDVGSLAGVPTLTKDTFSAKEGWPTSSGLSVLRDRRATKSTNYPRRFEAADGILVGTTNSAVFGFRGTTDSKAFGPTRNPFDHEFNAGGSSGGSAAAVAAGIVPVAGATDVGGSIRIPSAWCGTFGFQPSPGRAPFPASPNAFGPSMYFFEGPITRTVADSALVMDVLQGFDRMDPMALTGRVDFRGALGAGIKGKRVGFTKDFGIFPVQREVTDAVSRAVWIFEDLGAQVDLVDVGLPYSQGQLSDVWSRVTALGTMAALDALKASGTDVEQTCPDELPGKMMHWVETARAMSTRQLIADQIVRSVVFEKFAAVFEEFDFIVSPTLACMPVKNSDDGFTEGPSEINGEAIDPLIGWCMTYLTNFIGHPSASLPAGMSGGFPVGMQIMGRRNADRDVMAASAAFEAASPWHGMYDVLTASSKSVTAGAVPLQPRIG